MEHRAGFCACPGTAGEFIQGIFYHEPCLVSNPVSLFSYTLAELGREGESSCGEKQKIAARLFLEEKGLSSQIDRVRLNSFREMPLMKGMASSTADICSAVGACAFLFGKSAEEELLKEICIAIEPSDNLMFRKLNLMNHYSGRVFEDLHGSVSCPVLLLDFDKSQSTEAFGYEREFKKDVRAFEGVIARFKDGVKKGDLSQIGRACTDSARINQSALYREELPSIIKKAEESGAFGVTIGHSGSVIAILKGPGFEESSFIKGIQGELGIRSIMEADLIPGGIRGKAVFSDDLGALARRFKEKTGLTHQIIFSR